MIKKRIVVIVRDKVATVFDRSSRIVCGNSDYIITFDFDEEWSAYETKTARFTYKGTHTDIIFTGNTCEAPIISDTTYCSVGVFAGDLHTTTPAMIVCRKSILCEDGIPADPPPDVYAQLMELLNQGGESGGGGGTVYVSEADVNSLFE